MAVLHASSPELGSLLASSFPLCQLEISCVLLCKLVSLVKAPRHGLPTAVFRSFSELTTHCCKLIRMPLLPRGTAGVCPPCCLCALCRQPWHPQAHPPLHSALPRGAEGEATSKFLLRYPSASLGVWQMC